MEQTQFKFYVHYEQEPSFTHKFVWDQSGDTVESLIQSFVTAYNETNGSVHALETRRLQATREGKPLCNTASVSSCIKEGDDIYVVDYLPKDVLFKCGRNGCGKEFCEKDNTDTSCSFHPGQILFHEGLKGWKCCQKREIDFNDALKIPGCASGRHIPEAVKLIKPTKQQQSVVSEMDVTVSGDKEVYTDKHAASKPASAATKPAPAPAPAVKEAEIPDPPDAVIEIGTRCTHIGCSATFAGDASRTEKCEYHPGIAIFHEGSKGWSCCSAKALEFDELFKIEGCTEGVHKFIKDPPKPQPLRRDFYLMGDWVVVSVYTKNAKKTSVVTFEERKFHIKFELANGEVYEEDVPISHPCDPSASRFSVLSTKVEIKLRKTTEDWDPFHL